MNLTAISRSGAPADAIEQPPALIAEIGSAYAALYQSSGFQPPWTGYFALVDRECVGTCGFKGPPRGRQVEIAYFTFPGHEGRGHATRMAEALIEVVRWTDATLTVTAQTLPAEGASTAILRKLGFFHSGTVNHPEDGEVWEWARRV